MSFSFFLLCMSICSAFCILKIVVNFCSCEMHTSMPLYTKNPNIYNRKPSIIKYSYTSLEKIS